MPKEETELLEKIPEPLVSEAPKGDKQSESIPDGNESDLLLAASTSVAQSGTNSAATVATDDWQPRKRKTTNPEYFLRQLSQQ